MEGVFQPFDYFRAQLCSHREYPDPLCYHAGDNPNARGGNELLSNILYYNNSFAMCSIGSSQGISRDGSPFVIKFSGLIMHRSSRIHLRLPERRQKDQLYILHPSEAVQELMFFICYVSIARIVSLVRLVRIGENIRLLGSLNARGYRGALCASHNVHHTVCDGLGY